MSLSITVLACQSLALPTIPAPCYAPKQQANGNAIEETYDAVGHEPRQPRAGKHPESRSVGEDQKYEAGAGESVKLLTSIKESHFGSPLSFYFCGMQT
jgi:hypothetical protein